MTQYVEEHLLFIILAFSEFLGRGRREGKREKKEMKGEMEEKRSLRRVMRRRRRKKWKRRSEEEEEERVKEEAEEEGEVEGREEETLTEWGYKVIEGTRPHTEGESKAWPCYTWESKNDSGRSAIVSPSASCCSPVPFISLLLCVCLFNLIS